MGLRAGCARVDVGCGGILGVGEEGEMLSMMMLMNARAQERRKTDGRGGWMEVNQIVLRLCASTNSRPGKRVAAFEKRAGAWGEISQQPWSVQTGKG
jgi:hypothetical protein